MSYMRPHIASPIFAGSDAFVELRPTATVPDVDAGAVFFERLFRTGL